MKSMFLKYISALLAVWYCMSIIGFDVHSCTSTGNIFVNSVLGGITCDDIHPDHDCSGHGSCCKSHKCCDHKTEDDCCTDEIEVLDSESVLTSDDDVCFLCGSEPVAAALFASYDLQPDFFRAEILYHPDPEYLKAPDQQAVLGIWRI